jgi:hypothetical protein
VAFFSAQKPLKFRVFSLRLLALDVWESASRRENPLKMRLFGWCGSIVVNALSRNDWHFSCADGENEPDRGKQFPAER